ncbi:MAG: phosphoribosyltransferase family protein [bacterium]|nr:phosphoribosyltransferase family protein [bacterium]
MKNGMMGGVVNGVLDAVFPAVCIGCGEEGSYICMRCEGFASEVALICPLCSQSSLTGERHSTCASRYGLEGLASCWEYEGIVKSLLHSIKYNGITHATGETIARTFAVMVQDGNRFNPFLLFLSSPNTSITYVPMYRKKERIRGFNQAEVFAKNLAKVAEKEVLGTLEKISDTKPQVDLAKEERLYNVKDAFLLLHAPELRTIEKVILVDDIWTTGATMKECCKVLKSAGVQQVWGFTVARTP